jgi:hypothetical protein
MNAGVVVVVLALVAMCAWFHKDAKDARAAEGEWRRLAIEARQAEVARATKAMKQEAKP